MNDSFLDVLYWSVFGEKQRQNNWQLLSKTCKSRDRENFLKHNGGSKQVWQNTWFLDMLSSVQLISFLPLGMFICLFSRIVAILNIQHPFAIPFSFVITCIYLRYLPTYSPYITKACLYYFDPLKPHFYITKLGFTGGIHYFSYFCSKT